MTGLEPTIADAPPATPVRPVGAWLVGLVVVAAVAILWALVAALFLARA